MQRNEFLDPSELVRGIAMCLGFKTEEIAQITITPSEIEVEYLVRIDGRITGSGKTNIPWRLNSG